MDGKTWKQRRKEGRKEGIDRLTKSRNGSVDDLDSFDAHARDEGYLRTFWTIGNTESNHEARYERRKQENKTIFARLKKVRETDGRMDGRYSLTT